LVKYEKLPNWCQVCGFLGHEYKDHGDGLHAPQVLIFKDLMAKWIIHDGGRLRQGRSGPHGQGRAGMTRDEDSHDPFGRFNEQASDGWGDDDMEEDGAATVKKWGALLNPQIFLEAPSSTEEKGEPSLQNNENSVGVII
jgi:hypothetical protein